ncbi:related to beta-mannosidase [Fusarium torulosum]|uniref:Beta-mannosidase B n=1 Tax=Fusarium torulosum TaxID=33205 RepID=A0AAE8MAL0_9HYPO|nr:related to beta-mannosidase [Fusarium torulosum]
MPVTTQQTLLEKGWSFKKTADGHDAWKPVARVPTVAHIDLLDNGLIPDPFLDMNELDVEWVGETAWTYRTTFDSPSTDGASVYLLFDGLDTFAQVRLNDTVILDSDNMFLSHRVNISDHLKNEGSNTLIINFDSALLRGRELQKEYPNHRWELFNGEAGRLVVRKAQYHWGWDWGPMLNTAGPWRPVRLEVSSAHIENVLIKYVVSPDLKKIEGTVEVDVDGPFDKANVSIHLQEDVIYTTTIERSSKDRFSVSFTIDDPKLWYPAGYGRQSQYNVTVSIFQDGQELDKTTKKTGFRRSELVQKDDSYGKSFFFRINNIDIFCGGSCWIPADNFLPRITPGKYRDWLELMIEGNQIMTRVWGGGIYEEDVFYDCCDELGILVWQDFMFGCGNYPAGPSMIKSVREEAIQNVTRLHHHPSVIIYAGNNEDYQVQEQAGLEYDPEDKDPDSWLKSNFPARYYYEYLLPEVVSEVSPGVVYWPGSPFSGGKDTADKTTGDLHQWNVWHGTQEKYQVFDTLGGRFNSEFGMEAFPALSTINYCITDKSERFPQSQTMDFHNKADGHERRIATYVVENFRPLPDLESHLYITQLCQSEAMNYAYRSWRRQWGDDRRCGGVLVWQMNDCWPAISWSIVDYFLTKKPAYYALRRTLKPIAAGVQREHHDWSVVHARPAKTSAFSVWITSSHQQGITVTVEIRFVSIKTGEDIRNKVVKQDLVLVPNGTTNVLTGQIDNTKDEPHVISVSVLKAGVRVSRDVDWPQPLKYLDFSDRGVDIQVTPGEYRITAKRPTKGLVFEEVGGVSLDDNCIDLIPGEDVVVKASGSGVLPEPPKYRYLGM